jgi:hypothetical protein
VMWCCITVLVWGCHEHDTARGEAWERGGCDCEVSTMDAIESVATVAGVAERGLVVYGGTHRRWNCSAVRLAIQTWISDMLVTEDPPIVPARHAKAGSCVRVRAIERV